MRVMVVTVAGIVIAVVTAFFTPWQLAVLSGWDGAALGLLAWIWSSIAGLSSDETRTLATREDDSLAASLLLLLVASNISVVGVILAFIEAEQSHGALRVLLNVSSVVGVLLAWAVVHTVFTLRYARLYYSDTPGGIDFSQDTTPDYHDFAYVAFTVGMTFQVSDTNVSSKTIRREILRHALLSWLFGAIIVAITINLIAGLVR
jgi:uncharacterized membrane protein